MAPQFKTPKHFTSAQFWAYNAGRQSIRRNEWLKQARAESHPTKRTLLVKFAKEEHRASLRSIRTSAEANLRDMSEAA